MGSKTQFDWRQNLNIDGDVHSKSATILASLMIIDTIAGDRGFHAPLRIGYEEIHVVCLVSTLWALYSLCRYFGTPWRTLCNVALCLFCCGNPFVRTLDLLVPVRLCAPPFCILVWRIIEWQLRQTLSWRERKRFCWRRLWMRTSLT